MTRLTPADPHDVGVEEQVPDLAQLEGAHLLANEARPHLADCGFSEHQILEWAETYIALRAPVTSHRSLPGSATARKQHARRHRETPRIGHGKDADRRYSFAPNRCSISAITSASASLTATRLPWSGAAPAAARQRSRIQPTTPAACSDGND